MCKHEIVIRGNPVRIQFEEVRIGNTQVEVTGRAADGDNQLQSFTYTVDDVPGQIAEARNTIFEDMKKLAKKLK